MPQWRAGRPASPEFHGLETALVAPAEFQEILPVRQRLIDRATTPLSARGDLPDTATAEVVRRCQAHAIPARDGWASRGTSEEGRSRLQRPRYRFAHFAERQRKRGWVCGSCSVAIGDPIFFEAGWRPEHHRRSAWPPTRRGGQGRARPPRTGDGRRGLFRSRGRCCRAWSTITCYAVLRTGVFTKPGRSARFYNNAAVHGFIDGARRGGQGFTTSFQGRSTAGMTTQRRGAVDTSIADQTPTVGTGCSPSLPTDALISPSPPTDWLHLFNWSARLPDLTSAPGFHEDSAYERP